MIADTPEPPYYAVIFTSIRNDGDGGYGAMSDHLVKLAEDQEGYLGIESARQEVGVTVSYWRDLDSIKRWKENTQHAIAQDKGKSDWYQSFKVRIAKVERDYGFQL